MAPIWVPDRVLGIDGAESDQFFCVGHSETSRDGYCNRAIDYKHQRFIIETLSDMASMSPCDVPQSMIKRLAARCLCPKHEYQQVEITHKWERSLSVAEIVFTDLDSFQEKSIILQETVGRLRQRLAAAQQENCDLQGHVKQFDKLNIEVGRLRHDRKMFLSFLGIPGNLNLFSDVVKMRIKDLTESHVQRQNAETKLKDLEQQFSNANSTLNTTSQKLTSAQTGLQEVTASLSARDAELAKARSEYNEIKTALSKLEKNAKLVARERVEREAELKDIRQTLTGEKEKNERLVNELHQVEASLSTMKMKVEEQTTQLDASQHQIVSLETQLKTTQQSYDAFQVKKENEINQLLLQLSSSWTVQLQQRMGYAWAQTSKLLWRIRYAIISSQRRLFGGHKPILIGGDVEGANVITPNNS